jgi:hypothetical protein
MRSCLLDICSIDVYGQPTNLQSNFAICVLVSAMHVLMNVRGKLTTANNAHKHTAAVLKNVERCLDNLTILLFLDFLGIIIISLLALLPPHV